LHGHSANDAGYYDKYSPLVSQLRRWVEEIREGTDDLADWLSDRDHLDALRFDEEADVALVQRVKVEIIGRDPFLIAYALQAPAGRCVVTTEISKPKRVRANRHLPDVCKQIGVDCIDSFGLVKALNFSTSWRTNV